MKIKIVGVVPQNFTLDNGYHFEGNKIHAIDLETRADGQIGNQVFDFKISKDSKLYGVPLHVGCDYALYFNKKKEADFLSPISEDTTAIVDEI